MVSIAVKKRLSPEESRAAALDAANNAVNVAVVADILPRPDGTADLRIEPGPNNTNDYLFYHLSAVQIESRAGGTWFSLQ